MDIGIITAVSAGIDLVKSLGTGIIDLIGRGHPDETKLAELRQQYEMAVNQLDFNLKQAELWLREKMLTSASAPRWLYPLSMISGGAIIAGCLFNLVMQAIGYGSNINIFTPEWAILLGIFLYVTSGSNELLIKIALFLISKIPDKQAKPVIEVKETIIEKVNT